MIPFGILAGYFYTGKQKTEFRVLDLSADSFTFRLPVSFRTEGSGAENSEMGTSGNECNEKEGIASDMPDRFELHFYHRGENRYHQITLLPEQYTLLPEDEYAEDEDTEYENAEDEDVEDEGAEESPAAFWQSYRLITCSEAFSAEAGQLMKEYLNYIDLKMNGNDAELSQRLIGYPASGERIFAPDWEQQKRAMLESLQPDPEWGQVFRKILEFGIVLDREELYEKYLESDEDTFLKWYYRENHLEQHPIGCRRPELIAIGNQFCPHLLPESQKLEDLLAKIHNQGKKVIVLLPPLTQTDQERILKEMQESKPEESKPEESKPEESKPEKSTSGNPESEKTKRLLIHGREIEIIVNDPGTLKLLHEIQEKWSSENVPCRLILTAGSLMNKRRRDVRLKYKTEPDRTGPGENIQKENIREKNILQENIRKENIRKENIRKENIRKENILQENSWNLAEYSSYMRRRFGLTGRLEDACGYPVSLKEYSMSDILPDALKETSPAVSPDSAAVTLIAPFYQMNTAGHCTLYAACRNGSRGRQSAVSCCPHYCRDYVFLYPRMLNMVGRYNTLFGFDEKILADSAALRSYQEQGLKRILLQLL